MNSKYLEFVKYQPLLRKLPIYGVRSKQHGTSLGRIKWFCAWRQYCFFPENSTVFNSQCLADIRDFLKLLKLMIDPTVLECVDDSHK